MLFWRLIISMWMICPIVAEAYIDPGAGSLLFQAITASLLGIGIFWRRVVSFVRSLFGKKDTLDGKREKE
ncbi:MAG: hypothetical protein LBH38_00430 [Holosporales bacterium]|nr:hypothetical protein [Holosporales bacterium]